MQVTNNIRKRINIMNNETLTLLSSIGLILSIVPVTIHGIEAFFPMQARWIVNWVLPFLGNHPKVSQNCKNVGIVIAPFWAIVAILNGLAFV